MQGLRQCSESDNDHTRIWHGYSNITIIRLYCTVAPLRNNSRDKKVRFAAYLEVHGWL